MTLNQQKILVTGASGLIGRTICPFLESSAGAVRALDSRECDVVSDVIRADVLDLAALRIAARGVDAIIHLAACAEDADFVTHLVPPNVIGLYNVLEAARLEGVKRFIFASSCRTTDVSAERRNILIEECTPTDHYGLTKVWGERMAEMYSRRWGISVVAARLGWVVRDSCELEELYRDRNGPCLFLSRRDLREFFLRALTVPLQGYVVVFVVSRQLEEGLFEMETARKVIGFEPKDIFPEGAFD